jgi:hypothetical protein
MDPGSSSSDVAKIPGMYSWVLLLLRRRAVADHGRGSRVLLLRCGKDIYWQMSLFANVFWADVFWANVFLGKRQSGQMSSGQMSP